MKTNGMEPDNQNYAGSELVEFCKLKMPSGLIRPRASDEYIKFCLLYQFDVNMPRIWLISGKC